MDSIASFVAMYDGEIVRLESVQTIPQSTLRGKCDKIRKEMQHLFAVPVSQTDRKEFGRRRFEQLRAGCDQMEGDPTSPEMGTVFHVRPNLRLVKLQTVCRHEILSRSPEHAKLFRG
ncbi:unnamed protein product [Parnassius mnemosyne]|uniref:Uncharacterized protein n=1 Tax=Parnassius mnemosyne TaxID=213953 RepID=A0AAV1KIF9_9NEOP